MRFEFRHVPLVIERVRASGAPSADLAAMFQISDEEQARETVVGPVERIEALLVEAARRAGVPSFGLELAHHVQRGRFGWLEFGMRTAASIGEALQLLARYSALINRDAGYVYAAREHEGVLCYETPRRPGGLGPQLNEFTLGLVLAMAQQTGERRWAPTRVWFAHADPTSDVVVPHFGGAVSFGEATSGFALARAVVDAPLAAHDPALHGLLRARLDELLPAADSTHSATARARAEVLSRIGRQPLGVGDVSRALRLSVRTLQRELAAEGTTFAALVEAARRELAERLLARADLTLGEVGALLGYADLRGFDRAFLRWTGVTPSEWRSARAGR